MGKLFRSFLLLREKERHGILMKLTKNIMILFGSYLGAIALVSCVGQFLHSVSGESVPAIKDDPNGGDYTAGVLDSEKNDIPAAVTTDDTSVDESLGSTEDTKEPDQGAGSSVDTGEGEDRLENGKEIYYIRTVTGDGGTETHAIGVYDDSGKLLDVLDTPVFALPAKDRDLLSVGIRVEGDEELHAILEDLGA